VVAELIQRGEVSLLEALSRGGHLPEGLSRCDEALGGLSPAYLAIAYDRPEVLSFLARRADVDLKVACDDAGYGTPAFYAAYNARVRCLDTLVRLGVDCRDPCTKFGEIPSHFIDRHEPVLHDQLLDVLTLRDRAADRIQRWLRRFPMMDYFRAARLVVVCIQRRWRELRALRGGAPSPSPPPLEGAAPPEEEEGLLLLRREGGPAAGQLQLQEEGEAPNPAS